MAEQSLGFDMHIVRLSAITNTTKRATRKLIVRVWNRALGWSIN